MTPVRIICLVVAIAASGCTADSRSAIEVPRVDPTIAAAKALELYDKDGSKSLDQAELANCPGIFASRARYDTNSDRQISGDEIATRLAALFGTGVGMTPVVCEVTRGGQPLSGATVRFVPEPFLQDKIKPAIGTTDDGGIARIAIPDDQLPADQHGLRAMQPGIYRVEIEHPSIKQPHVPLGCEIDPTSRGGTEPVFRL